MRINDYKNNRLAICVPCRDQVQSLFTYHLVKLIQYCSKKGLHTELFMQTGSLIAKQRQELALSAVNSGATHVLWLDSDMTFPPDIAEQLLATRCDIVAGNYSTRSHPRKGVAYKTIGDWKSWLLPSDTNPRLQEVEGVGMGCMLVNSEVFSEISKPWFEVSWVPEWNEYIGEDFYFCMLARQAGYKIMIDTYLNKRIKHIGICEFSINTIDTNEQ